MPPPEGWAKFTAPGGDADYGRDHRWFSPEMAFHVPQCWDRFGSGSAATKMSWSLHMAEMAGGLSAMSRGERSPADTGAASGWKFGGFLLAAWWPVMSQGRDWSTSGVVLVIAFGVWGLVLGVGRFLLWHGVTVETWRSKKRYRVRGQPACGRMSIALRLHMVAVLAAHGSISWLVLDSLRRQESGSALFSTTVPYWVPLTLPALHLVIYVSLSRRDPLTWERDGLRLRS